MSVNSPLPDLLKPTSQRLGVRAGRLPLIDEGDDVPDEETLQPAVGAAVVVAVPRRDREAGAHQGEVVKVLQSEQAGLLQAVAVLRIKVGQARRHREHVEEAVGFARAGWVGSRMRRVVGWVPR